MSYTVLSYPFALFPLGNKHGTSFPSSNPKTKRRRRPGRTAVQVPLPLKMGSDESISSLRRRPSSFVSTQGDYSSKPCTLRYLLHVSQAVTSDHGGISSMLSDDFCNGKQVQEQDERVLEKQRYVYDGGFTLEMILASISIGFALWCLGPDQSALAFFPEGPLVEEFWENMRRYGLYFLTVGTGALYTIVKPIGELLRSPLSAVLVIATLSGSFYLLYLILNAMIGASDFVYQYAS